MAEDMVVRIAPDSLTSRLWLIRDCIEQELGFEGLDRLTDKYHDKAWDHAPAIRRKTRQEKQANRQGNNGPQQQHQQYHEDQAQPNTQNKQQRQPSQKSSRHPDKGYESSRAIPPGFPYDPAKDPGMYGSERGQERYGRDDRYSEDGRSEYKAPGPGFKVHPPSRGREDYNGTRGMQVEVSSHPDDITNVQS
jgi:hypothetical protein